MFGLSKFWTYLIAGAAGAALIAGTFGAGVFYGKASAQVKVEKENMLDYLGRVETAFNIVDDFARIAKLSAEQTNATRESGKTIARTGADYVRRNPQPAPATPADRYLLPAHVVELRRCQIDEIYRAAGHSLPRERDGAVCPPPVPAQQ